MKLIFLIFLALSAFHVRAEDDADHYDIQFTTADDDPKSSHLRICNLKTGYCARSKYSNEELTKGTYDRESAGKTLDEVYSENVPIKRKR